LPHLELELQRARFILRFDMRLASSS